LYTFTTIDYILIETKKERYAPIKLLLPPLPGFYFKMFPEMVLPVNDLKTFIYLVEMILE
jgi:hypothetical protein